MKNLIIALSSAAIFSMSAAVMAGDANVTVEGSVIHQEQWGYDLKQDAVIGLVSDDFQGSAKIVVKKSKIFQSQEGNANKQVAKIGVVGCDCADHKKGNYDY